MTKRTSPRAVTGCHDRWQPEWIVKPWKEACLKESESSQHFGFFCLCARSTWSPGRQGRLANWLKALWEQKSVAVIPKAKPAALNKRESFCAPYQCGISVLRTQNSLFWWESTFPDLQDKRLAEGRKFLQSAQMQMSLKANFSDFQIAKNWHLPLENWSRLHPDHPLHTPLHSVLEHKRIPIGFANLFAPISILRIWLGAAGSLIEDRERAGAIPGIHIHFYPCILFWVSGAVLHAQRSFNLLEVRWISAACLFPGLQLLSHLHVP